MVSNCRRLITGGNFGSSNESGVIFLNKQDGDIELLCADCNEPFLFTARDQQFFAEKGFSQPKRCFKCRQKKKAERYNAQTRGVEDHRDRRNDGY